MASRMPWLARQPQKPGDGARHDTLWAGALVRARARASALYRCAGGRGGAGWLPGGVDGLRWTGARRRAGRGWFSAYEREDLLPLGPVLLQRDGWSAAR